MAAGESKMEKIMQMLHTYMYIHIIMIEFVKVGGLVSQLVGIWGIFSIQTDGSYFGGNPGGWIVSASCQLAQLLSDPFLFLRMRTSLNKIGGWKMEPLKMYCIYNTIYIYILLNMGLFHCYVSLPEGIPFIKLLGSWPGDAWIAALGPFDSIHCNGRNLIRVWNTMMIWRPKAGKMTFAHKFQ